MNMKEKGMQKKMFAALAAAAVVVIIAAALMLALGRREETYRSIKIIELEGGVTIEREGVGVLTASSNMNLISGDEVKTEQNAYAVLQLDSDKYVMLAESGSMTVVAEGDEANSRTAIQLDSGSVLSEIQNPLSSGSSYDIVTPNATMSVRGTVFEVRKNEDGAVGDIEVLVYEGKVAVELNGMESAFYEAGEYTQFTADQNPQFIIERAEISEENLNPQFMDRLEQINSQSRELNLGTAQLASVQEETAEPRQAPTVSEPVATPSRTAEPAQTATPKPEAAPVATPAPVSTPGSQAGAGETNVTTPAPEVPVDQSPAEDQDDDQDDEDNDDEDQNETDNSGSAQQPGNVGNGSGNAGDDGGNTGNTGDNNGNQGDGSWDISNKQNFWQEYTLEDYKQAVANSPAAGTECVVVYYVPEIVESVELDGDGKRYSTLVNTPPVCTAVKTTAGSRLTEPAVPEKDGLTFAGWCLEDGTKWDFANDEVKADMCLFPVWSDGIKDCYFPVICRSEERWCYYCNSVEAGSFLKEPALSEGNDPSFNGWENVFDGNVWDMVTEAVQGAVSLKAVWSNL